jgi:hypothetical protein
MKPADFVILDFALAVIGVVVVLIEVFRPNDKPKLNYALIIIGAAIFGFALFAPVCIF